jgi:hypothetical protein
VVGCGNGGNSMWWAAGGVAEAAKAVEAASKVWGDYSLIILSYTKHQYHHQQLSNYNVNQ